MQTDLYPHRGFMLDTGRKFFPVPAILELLTVLQQHNFNVFHWHLYDSESFPLQWPANGGLGNVSMAESHSSDHYTPQDIERVISHARQLGILVYPETDMPGHSDIWGLWDPNLVVGKVDLEKPDAQLDIRKQHTYDTITSLVGTVDNWFHSPIHHFGADEVEYMYGTQDDNKLFESFLHWLKTLLPSKQLILWDDPLTDYGKNINLTNDWIIQTWHNGVTRKILDKGHRVIVSEMDTFYIGNSDCSKVRNFTFPDHGNVLGYEVVWFTSEDDDPYDFRKCWVMDPLKAASQIRRNTKCGS